MNKSILLPASCSLTLGLRMAERTGLPVDAGDLSLLFQISQAGGAARSSSCLPRSLAKAGHVQQVHDDLPFLSATYTMAQGTYQHEDLLFSSL